MQRRGFLATLLALPLVARVAPAVAKPRYENVEYGTEESRRTFLFAQSGDAKRWGVLSEDGKRVERYFVTRGSR